MMKERSGRTRKVAVAALQVRSSVSGSNEPYVYGLLGGLASLRRDDIDVHVFSVETLHIEDVRDGLSLKYHVWPRIKWKYAGYLLRIIQEFWLANVCKFDVVLMTGTSACPISRCAQVAVVHWDARLQPKSAPLLRKWANIAMMYLVKWRAKMVIVPTEAYRKFLIQQWNWDSKRITAVHHGINRGDVRDEIAKADGSVVAVLNDLPHKNVDILLKAWHKIVSQERRSRVLTLVGRIRDTALDSMSLDWRHLEDNGSLVRTSWLRHDEVMDLISRCELLVSPSEGETFCMPLLESMASGTAVLAMDSAVVREVCGQAAEYEGSRDPERWAERIETLLADKERRNQLVAEGRGRARAMTWDVSASSTLDVLLEAIED